MQVKTFYTGGFAAVSYLVTDDTGKFGVLIDPAVPYETVLMQAVPMPQIVGLLLTHGHFDHMLTLAEWKAKTGAPIGITREDAPALGDAYLNCNRYFFDKEIVYPPADRLLIDKEEIIFGEEKLTVMMTPGHTVGSCVYLGDGVMFTGDTVMADGGYGRYDLPGGSPSALYASLTAVAALEGDFVIYPGHGRASTLKEERNFYIR